MMLDRINEVRAGYGLPGLRQDGRLAEAAVRHSRDMAAHSGLMHVGSDGSTSGERIAQAGYRARRWQEVVGWGFEGNIERMIDWWMNSPNHRPILLDGGLVEAGVGYVYAPGSEWGHYWTVDFAVPVKASYTAYAPVVVSSGDMGIDLLSYKLADPDCWRVIQMTRSDGTTHSEDIQDMELADGLFVRRKNTNGEWHRYDSSYFYLVHDTSPDVGTEGVARVYTLYKDNTPGAPKSRRRQSVGEVWRENGLHRVRFRARHDCRDLTENSGMAQNSSVITRFERNYTFNRYGQNLTFDEVIFERTGVETQIYGRKDGKSCGWIGWQAPWGSSEPVAIYWDRGRLTTEPNRYCGF